MLHFTEEDQSTVITLDEVEQQTEQQQRNLQDEDQNLEEIFDVDQLEMAPTQAKSRRIEDEELEVCKQYTSFKVLNCF